MKNKSQTVRIPAGCLWKAPHSMAQDSKGKKIHMCWPLLEEKKSWFADILSVLENGDTPRYVTYDNGKSTWHFKLSCYDGGEGWWYDWDMDRNIDQDETYRLYLPRELKYHPSYESTKEEA